MSPTDLANRTAIQLPALYASRQDMPEAATPALRACESVMPVPRTQRA